jgi:uncharacterized protein (TIGR03086 family)
MQPLAALEVSLGQTRPIVGGVTADQLDLPTPCSEWDVRALLNHMLGVITMFRDLPAGNPDMAALGGDHVGDDPAAVYDDVATATLAAWRMEGVVDNPVQFPGSDMPGDFAARLLAGDVLLHGWDLAHATGQTVAWNQELAADALDWHEEAVRRFPPALRASGFSPPVAVSPDADPMTRLVGFAGRQPLHL